MLNTRSRQILLALIAVLVLMTTSLSISSASAATKYKAPTGLKVTATAYNAIAFKWSAVKSAPKYRLKVSTHSNMTKAVYYSSSGKSMSRIATSLKPNTTYYAQVRVITTGGNGLSSYSKITKAKTYKQLATPSISKLSSTETTITASWKAVSGAGKYAAFISTSSNFKSYKKVLVTSPTVKFTGLTNNTLYYVKLQSLTKEGTARSPLSVAVGFQTIKKETPPVDPNTPAFTFPPSVKLTQYTAAVVKPGYTQTANTIVEMPVGPLPPGMVLDNNTGVVSGTPTTPGTYKVELRARNTAGGMKTVKVTFTVAVAPPGTVTLPSQLIDLTNWKLTLPIGSGNSPTEVLQPALKNFSDANYFHLTADKTGVVFNAPAGGVTTSNSGYPRSELREMTNNGATQASWSHKSGQHSMAIRGMVTHLPAVKPHVVIAQIHDASDDVLMVRLEGKKLFVESEGVADAVLDSNYTLGEQYVIQLIANSGGTAIYYNNETNGKSASTLNPRKTSGNYFKAGCYTQSNPSKGDAPSAYGEVVIKNLYVTHS